jgi:hypothetical protein
VIRYLTGASGIAVEQIAYAHDVGLMIQPGNRYDKLIHRFPMWCADNGAFTTDPRGFDPTKFRTMLHRPELRQHAARCLFVVAPDKLVVLPSGDVVGDAAGTLEQFPAWAEEIHRAGLPVALVAQNGLEGMLGAVLWDSVDVLFLGGSTEWKLGAGARHCVDVAHRMRKRTHMGRVNSYRRLSLANSWGVDTADGTFLKFGMKTNIPRMLEWLRRVKGETLCECTLPGQSTGVQTQSVKTGAPEPPDTYAAEATPS